MASASSSGSSITNPSQDPPTLSADHINPGIEGHPSVKLEEEQTELETTRTSTSDDSRKRLFSKELRHMMFGLGDDQNPYTESVDLIEDLVIEFISEMTQKGMDVGRSGRVQVEDILHLVRKDVRKYARVKDLLTMNEELKKARKAFDEVKYAGV